MKKKSYRRIGLIKTVSNFKAILRHFLVHLNYEE